MSAEGSPKVQYFIIFLVTLLIGTKTPARAHPMGNFSINHYARFTCERRQINLRYVLDMAEIPTVTEVAVIDADRDRTISSAELTRYASTTARKLSSGLSLAIDDRLAATTPVAPEAEMLPGAGGLQTLRITFSVTANLPASSRGEWRIAYRDSNFPERTGWKEIVASAGGGLTLRDSTAAAADISGALTAYPSDPAIAAPRLTEARFTLGAGTETGLVQAATVAPAAANGPNSTLTEPPRASMGSRTPQDAFTQSISRPNLGVGVVLVSLSLAFLFGALHALSPGHGKAMVAAYLVGTRGTMLHAAFLGGVITLAHTVSVYALGLVTLVAAQYVVPERLYPVLSLLSGGAVAAVGIALLWVRVRDYLEARSDSDAELLEEDAPPPLPPGAVVSWKSLVVLGITGGALPCPSALVVMLGAIALHRIAFGFALIGAFSLGLAIVLTGLGLLVVRLRTVLDRLPLHPRAIAALPILSAALVTVVGVALIARALGGQY